MPGWLGREVGCGVRVRISYGKVSNGSASRPPTPSTRPFPSLELSHHRTITRAFTMWCRYEEGANISLLGELLDIGEALGMQRHELRRELTRSDSQVRAAVMERDAAAKQR